MAARQFTCPHCNKQFEYKPKRKMRKTLSRGAINRKNDITFKTWKAVKKRCLYPSCKAYRAYGGKGITICEEWMNFEVFLKDMGPRPSPEHSIDRIDNEKGYQPGNCRWATSDEQNHNRRISCRWITIDGVTKSFRAWAKSSPVHITTIKDRLRGGWGVKEAFLSPSLGRGHHRGRRQER